MGKKGIENPLQAPADLGYRMPAEWEPHEATWLGWPQNRTDWPGKFEAIPWTYAEITSKLAPGEIIRFIVGSKENESHARRVLKDAGVDPARIEFFRFPTNRGWTRDSGPMFVRRSLPSPAVAVTGFGFNAWARYKDWSKDARVHERAAKALGCPLFRPSVGGRTVILEGGSVDFNGSGTMLTTEECLLDRTDQPRNPGLTRDQLESVLRGFFSVSTILWLGRGIAGDDTHGHVDDLCRFVNHDTVVLCKETNPRDENYRALEENRERLEGMSLEDGSRVKVVPLPMPSPLFFRGQRLPASYANFYIANAAVLVPTFNDPSDRIALGILSEVFEDRPVVGIHAVDLVWGFGTLHCLSREQPAL